MDKRTILTLTRAASVVLVLAAIVVQAFVLADAGRFDATRFFAFFTIQSNLVGVAAFIWLLATRGRARTRGQELLRGAAAVYLTVTFVVVIVLLSDVDVQLQLVWVDVVLHKLFPIVVVLDWIVDPPTRRLPARGRCCGWCTRSSGRSTVVRGAVDGWYPYPFLDPANGGYGQVAVSVVGVTRVLRSSPRRSSRSGTHGRCPSHRRQRRLARLHGAASAG
jgi:hypothetical protein